MNKKAYIQPVVTIITMTRNAEKYIQQTLDSVKNQDYRYIEHLIIDGGSSDRTLEIVRGHGGRHGLQILSELSNSTSAALNMGFSMASGKYVWALNSDDSFADSTTVSRLVSYLESHPLCDFVFGNMFMIDEKDRRIGCRSFHYNYGFEDLLCDRRHLPFAGCLLRRSSLERTGGGFDTMLSYCNDLDFFFRISLYGRMEYISEETGVFRLHSQSVTSSNIRETGGETLAVCLKYLELPEAKMRVHGREKRIRARIYMHASGVSFHSGYPSEVKKNFLEAAKLDSFSLLISVKPWLYLISSLFGFRGMRAISSATRRLIHKRFWYSLNNLSTP